MTTNSMTVAPSPRTRSIVYVIGSLDIGGTERHLALVAPAIKKQGWEPTIHCLTHRGTQAEEVERQGIAVIAPPFGGASGHSRLVYLLALAASCVMLLATLAWRRPAITHFFLPMSYIIGGSLAIVTRVPIRIMSRRSRNLYQSRYPLIARLESFLHRHMSCIVGNSRSVIEDLRSEGCDAEKLKLIYNGVDCQAVASTPPLAPRDRPGLILIIVANLIPYKGHADLIRALSAVNGILAQSWELWCVGRDDCMQAQLASLANSFRIGDRVKFLGQRKDVIALLKAADIGILCSHEEGFANAILEGMAAALPMVVTNVGGNAEAVIHGETGLIVPPSDPDALGKAILALALDPNKRKQMGENGRQRALKYFSLEQCVQQYCDLYGKLQN